MSGIREKGRLGSLEEIRNECGKEKTAAEGLLASKGRVCRRREQKELRTHDGCFFTVKIQEL